MYQDLFQEGSFTGKGIYEVDAFASAMCDRVPDNTLLSHDLFEGVFARAGLVTDVELFDEFPSDYLEESARQHRWARGDWQLLPWILGRGPRRGHTRTWCRIGGVDRWKMVDNLRRTLTAPLALATLIAAWTVPSASAGWWTLLVLASVVVPPAIPVISGLIPRRRGISKRSHLRDVVGDVIVAAAQVMLSLTFLIHQAWLMGDAIVRTLARLLFTRKHLLEWQTAAQVKADREPGLQDFYRQMAGSVGLAVIVGLTVGVVKPECAWIAAPFVVLWLAAPWIARQVSLPGVVSEPIELDDRDVRTLRLIARRTWLFFETFVATNEHGLPPDNFQDAPQPEIAHRTSPTNIGMYLLATVSARDFGWIGTLDMVERLETTLATVTRLERFHGHLFNWYDTRTLQRLEPDYVSTVDSGNLAGHLIAVSNACRQMIDQPLALVAALDGIGDAMALAGKACDRNDDGSIVTLEQWSDRLAALGAQARAVATGDSPTTPPGAESDDELVMWAHAAESTANSHLRDLALLHPVESTGAELTVAELADRPSTRPHEASMDMLVRRLQAVADDADRLIAGMDFRFLFDPVRKLFSIGFRVREGALDPSYYDMLASEARLTSFIAIAKGDVEADHWFRLGRGLTPVGRGSALISWSGSMFEYLMPVLVMRAPVGSLLEQTSRLVVVRQIRYATELGIPWGISESGYNARDLMQTYQYSGFGVPGLALKRGLSEDMVVAPYATALAAMIDPGAAVRNFERLSAEGAAGRYGFREALDYTARRLPAGASVAVVKSYMAHHQGMTLVALGNVVNDVSMVERFHAEPIVEATELLLQERMPRNALVSRPRAEEVKSAADVRDSVPPILRRFTSPHDTIPRTHLLSNGRYSVMLTTAGSGYSRWRHLAVTRWREDVTCDPWGSFLYVRDTSSGAVWSPGFQPAGREADTYEVLYSEDQAEFSRRDGSITTSLTIAVSAEDDAEIRRASLTNLGSRPTRGRAHLVPGARTRAAGGRRRPPHIPEPLRPDRVRRRDRCAVGHASSACRRRGADLGGARGNGGGTRRRRHPVRDRSRTLSRTRSCDQVCGVGDRRATVVEQCRGGARPDLQPSPPSRDRTWRDGARDLRDPGGGNARAGPRPGRQVPNSWRIRARSDPGVDARPGPASPPRYRRRRSAALPTSRQPDPVLRPIAAADAERARCATVEEHPVSGLTASPVTCRSCWFASTSSTTSTSCASCCELTSTGASSCSMSTSSIINEHGATYADDLHGSLESMVRASQSSLGHQSHPSHGGVFVLRGERLSADDRTLLQTAARAVLLSRRGSLADQVIRLERPMGSSLSRTPARAPDALEAPHDDDRPPALPRLEFFNGMGGFDKDGREYVTVLRPGQSTPAPWLNVIANSSFGFQVSESGSGYTWAGNSRENQLTPWSNDPVSDPSGEAFYVRDDDTGEVWSPTAQPIRCAASTYVARHGAGYSRFEHLHDRIQLDDGPVRAAPRTSEDLRAHHRESVRANTSVVAHRVRRVGPRDIAWSQRALDRHRARPRNRGIVGNQPMERRLR